MKTVIKVSSLTGRMQMNTMENLTRKSNQVQRWGPFHLQYFTHTGEHQQLETFYNYNLHDIITPINVTEFGNLLRESKFPGQKTDCLIRGFKYGFDIGYQGPWNRTELSNNMSFHVGDEKVMWTKIMKEVKVG